MKLTEKQIKSLKEDLESDTSDEILVMKYGLDIKEIQELKKNQPKFTNSPINPEIYNLNVQKIKEEIELLDEKRREFELKGDWQAWTKITSLKEQYIELLTKKMENVMKLKLQAYQVESKVDDVKKAVLNFIERFAESWEDDKIIIRNREMVQDLERRKGIFSISVDEKSGKEKKSERQAETTADNQ